MRCLVLAVAIVLMAATGSSQEPTGFEVASIRRNKDNPPFQSQGF